MTTRKTTKKSAGKSAAGKKSAAAPRSVKKAVKRAVAATKSATAKKAATKKTATTKKSATGKKSATTKKSATGRGAKAARGGKGAFRAKIRMYRQGLGDCFLITLPRKNGKPFYVVIDCGVILGTKEPKAIMGRVVQNIIDTTGGHIHLLAATHEHWDHLSGFLQARELWEDREKLKIDEVWMAWTENAKDELARKLGKERHSLRIALSAASARMRMAGDGDGAGEVTSLIEFFGAVGGGTTTADALEIVKSLTENPRYCRPDDAPVTLDGTGVKVYVLGPPLEEKFIKKYNPSKNEPETYGIDSMNMFMSGITPALVDATDVGPFDATHHIPLQAAEQVPFFQQHYWGEDADSEEKDQGWRQIQGSWLDSSSSLALQLDSSTNNTSLVLAFELDGGDVLLFASDAQVGNWLSWSDLSWKVKGKAVTGPDLLHRTIFYKVGHHGSHNATLREQGLEQMKGLRLAFLPVDHEMALKKRWGKMPFDDLLDRLNEKTQGRVVRIDEDVPPQLKKSVEADELFYEVSL
ncbi:MAG TPA: hypothetical protein VM934_03700 [Pyrinomonadaceae bacterium]|jgi:hypothetical protein|nr:hypothetical protein [Pyrinomonadaceae bacterium]